MMTLLISNLISVRTGVEDLFVKETNQIVHTTSPGRPSVATMISFILIIVYGILSISDSAKLRKSAIWTGYIVAAIGTLAALGYALNLPPLYFSFEGWSTAMAVHTSILFMLSGSAMILEASSKIQEVRTESLKIGTKVFSLFLLVAVIPIVFVGTLSYGVTRDPTSADSFGASLLIIGGITTSVIAGFSFYTSRSIVKPILEIKAVARQIAEGNLSVKANENYTDEVGELGADFNHMISSIKSTEELRVNTEKLREINKAKAEFIAMISHELKTPLVPIKGYVEMLRNESYGKLNDNQKEKLEIIKNSSESLLRIIADLLDAQKIELGQLKYNKKENNLKFILEKAVDTMNIQAMSSQIQLLIKADDLRVYCDEDRIHQVVTNLIKNGLKACQPKIGKIEIFSEEFANEVKVSIRDNGSGIPDNELDKLFNKFYQVNTSTTREKDGSGLGLSICKGIVEAHNGEIKVESKLGQGTTFSFTLPKLMS
jgi:signal transduction histidine kinase